MTLFTDHCTVDDAAQVLGIHPESMRRLLRQGALSYARLGRRWLIPTDALTEFARTYSPNHKSPCARAAHLRDVTMNERRATLKGNIEMLRGK